MELKDTFDQDADTYQRTRPVYPETLFNTLISETGLRSDAKLLEIGPGTGQATVPFARTGYSVVAVELGKHLAAKAQEVLKNYPNVQIINEAFEDVKLPAHYFDLIYSATAFHWIKPVVKYTRSHLFLKDGGHLAIIHTEHVSDEKDDALFHAAQHIYKKYHDDFDPDFRQPKIDELQPPQFDEKLFQLADFRPFPLVVNYSAKAYADLLSTFSPTIAMSKVKRAGFLHEITDLVEQEFDGHVAKHYAMTLTILRKID